MQHRVRRSSVPVALLVAAVASLALSACGSAGSSQTAAKTLLQQTFNGSHTVNSGNLAFSVTVTPSGSSTLTTPIVFSFGGPFQSRGAGRLPASSFNVSLSTQGKTASLGILSTGAAGYVTLQGESYQLPAATFQRLESSFGSIASSGSSGSGALSTLGIDPLHWLVDPTVVGSENIDGVDTTHIHAGVNVSALLADLNTFLQKASSLGLSNAGGIPTSISPSTRSKIAAEVTNPSFDVWTGTADKTARKLAVDLTVPVSGQFSPLLGGLSSAGIGITMQYANVNQPQTITAPANAQPYSQFEAKIKPILQELEGALAGGLSGGSASGSSGSSSSGSSASVQRYSQCIQAAGNDVGKMQKCASLLNGR
jgi:hypothetical protein